MNHRQPDATVQIKSRAVTIRKVLKAKYPETETPLIYGTSFQLLVAVILSAQCTDRQVNRVTPALFRQLKTPADFAGAQLKTIEK